MKLWGGLLVIASIYGGMAGLYVGAADILVTGNWRLLAASGGIVWAGALLGKYVEAIKD